MEIPVWYLLLPLGAGAAIGAIVGWFAISASVARIL
jgi:hypothetical protein